MQLRSILGRPLGRAAILALPLTASLLAGCAEGALETSALSLENGKPADTAAAEPAAAWSTAVTRKETEFKVTPETAALIKDARAMRDRGEKAKALEMLEKAPDADKDIALVKERGLLAAELGNLGKAEQLLRKAQDPARPDWRVHSALGATLSANGQQEQARIELKKALALAPDHPSILNNLALTYAMEGNQDEAERTLRKALSQNGPEQQPKQNLALVLGIKGNIDEARRVTAGALPPEKAAANIAYLEGLKNGHTAVSKADSAPAPAIKAASLERSAEKPIMNLGAGPD